MTVWHLNHRHHDWKHFIDYETLWILAVSVAVIGSWIFAMMSIAENNPHVLP